MRKIIDLESYKISIITLKEAREIIFATETQQVILDSIIAKVHEIFNKAYDFWINEKFYKMLQLS